MFHASRLDRRTLQVLRTLAERLNREVELRPMLDFALGLILELLDLSTGWIVLLDDEERFTLAATRGLPPALAADQQAALRWGPCRCQRMLSGGELAGAANIVACERLERVRQALAGADPETLNAEIGGLHAHVSVPLQVGSRTLGLLNVARAGEEPLDHEALTLLELVADTLAVAIERARLYAQVEEARREEAVALTQLTQTLLGLTGLAEIGAAVLAVLRRFLQPDGLSLLVADPSSTFLELVAGWGWSEAYIGRLQLPLHPPDGSGPAWALHVRQPVVQDHTKLDIPFTVPDLVRRAGVQMCIHLPMVTGRKATGTVTLDYHAPRAVDEQEIRFANLIVGVAAVAVERALEHRRYRTLFEQVPVALYRSTPSGRLLDVNSTMVRLLGYPDRETLLAANAVDLFVNPQDRARWQQLMDHEGIVVGFEVQWRRFDGRAIWVREAAQVVRDAAGRAAYYEGCAEDITARKRVESELHYLASHDPLTGAFNRRRFQEALHEAIAQARRTGSSGALLFIDLDNFKEVNDRLGHKAGDDVLRAVVRAIRARLRETDCLVRLGGDEFGVAVTPSDARQALEIAERILDAVRELVVQIDGRPLQLTASCGVALFPGHGATVDEVLAAADRSMYAAKDQGGNRAVMHVPAPA